MNQKVASVLNIKVFCLYMLITLLSACGAKLPITTFELSPLPAKPDYSQSKYWAFDPINNDPQSLMPKNYSDPEFNLDSEVDVFYIHPTFYLEGELWNANLKDKKLMAKIEDLAITHQASVFTGIANIYAPHYREMHIRSYSDDLNGGKAFKVAFSDILEAFTYYWKHHNKGKPFILAGHSQGTNHAEFLLKELILKNEKMKEQLTMTYLIGMPIKSFSDELPPCEAPDDINCFVSWRTYAEHYYPNHLIGDSIVSVSPISWRQDSVPSLKEKHKGILFKNRKLYYPGTVSVYNHKGMLWMKKLEVRFLKLYKRGDYHIADYNLFWLNIRENLRARLRTYELEE